MPDSKYLFLDLDGVTHSVRNADDYRDEFGPYFYPEPIALIHRLQKETGCDIVISSQWRNRKRDNETGLQAMQRMAQLRKLPFTISDTTECDTPGASIYTSRAQRILDYLMQHTKSDLCTYCILDDIDASDFYPHQRSQLVQTDSRSMTAENYALALEILSRPSLVLRHG